VVAFRFLPPVEQKAEIAAMRFHAQIDTKIRAFLRGILLEYRDEAFLKWTAKRTWEIVSETVDQQAGKVEPFHVRRVETYTSASCKSMVRGKILPRAIEP
jgi:hypothetical protein